MNRRARCALLLCSLLVAVAGIASPPAWAGKPVAPILAREEIPPDLLLDVGIQILDPGIPDEDESALEAQGIYAGVRESEARFIPYHLKTTLESTGQWGAVRVVPAGVEAGDVRVSGEIQLSTGKNLVVHVRAVDSSGRVWRDRRYKQEADSQAYGEGQDRVDRADPYQDLYDRIANDLLAERDERDPAEIRELRQITSLKFAADLAPAAFGDYLTVNKKGRCEIERLPAQDDPMLQRLARIRDRDNAFVDTLNEYYADFYARMSRPYDQWRGNSYDEQVKLQAIRREARLQKIFGGILLLGAAMAGGDTTAERAARNAAAVGGAVVLSKGIETGKEAKINREALKELAASFEAEIQPVLVEVDGQTLRLEGSAEAQYAEWRRLLAQIFATETGLPVDPDTGNRLQTAAASEN